MPRVPAKRRAPAKRQTTAKRRTLAKRHPAESRISMRVDADRKAVIAQAARLSNKTISDFILENAYAAAQEAIANETQVLVTKEQFDFVCKILDNPPAESLRRMRKLLNSKTILD
jgi:uncharacterized protein (DUF1778 family)